MPTASPAVPVDLRALLAPIRDQGQRGTCVAFAVTAAHEVGRATGAPPENLSDEALYWACKRTDSNWTSGTTFASASSALGRWGQPLEADWPYEPKRKDGAAYSPPSRAGSSRWFRSGLRRVDMALHDVRSQLDGGSLVLLGITVFDTFYRPDADGRIADPLAGARERGRHAVLAVGHQNDEMLIRNSWGTTWGLDGYAWIGNGYVAAHTRAAWIHDASAGTSGSPPGGTHSTGPEETYGAR